MTPQTRTMAARWFRNRYYFRLNARRLELLASLGLPLHNRRVFEVGAGIGDLTEFFLDRGCSVMATEGRADNLAILAERFADNPNVNTHLLDLDEPADAPPGGPWEIGFCFGVLYHLSQPAKAIELVARHTTDMLLLETVCGVGDDAAVNLVPEDSARVSQSMRGTGCRTTRRWVIEELRKYFEHVYITTKQPSHPEFVREWVAPDSDRLWVSRAIFVASRAPLGPDTLTTTLLAEQERH